MSFNFCLIAILFILTKECEQRFNCSHLILIFYNSFNAALNVMPELKAKGHAPKGNYSWPTEETCGYLSPNDVKNSKDGYTPKTRIINGDLAKLGEFPWQVTIFHKYRQDRSRLCDGVLIHDLWVLTVKTCVLR